MKFGRYQLLGKVPKTVLPWPDQNISLPTHQADRYSNPEESSHQLHCKIEKDIRQSPNVK